MDLRTLIYIFVGTTFVLYFFIALWSRASSTRDFYAAGRGVSPMANGMATAADWMSAVSFISLAGFIASLGYDAGVYIMGWTGGYVLLTLLIAPYLRKHGKYTVPEFIGDRFYSQTARVIAVLCLIIVSVTYVIGQMKGVGVAFSRFLEVRYETGLYAGMAIVFFYAVLGGMKGITYTQIAQYVVLITAYSIPAIFLSIQITDNALPSIGMFSDVAGSGTPFLTKLDQVATDLGFKQYTAQTGSTPIMVLIMITMMIGTAGLPHIIVRFFTVPKVSDARWSGGWTLVFIAVLYLTAPPLAAMGYYNLIRTVQDTQNIGSEDGNLLYADRPQWFKNWEATGLLQFQDKNGDGRIQYYNDKNPDFAARAQEYGWKGSELFHQKGGKLAPGPDRDILTLATPEIAQLPNWVIALVAAGGIAAALSTAAGLLLAISSAISHDLLKGMFMPDISEQNELLAARISMAGAIAVAGYLGLDPPGIIAEVVALAFGLSAASIFPALVMGIFSKRINNIGAVCGMLASMITTLGYIFIYKGIFFIPGTNLLPNTADYHVLGIPPHAFGCIAAVLNVIVAYTVTALTAPTPQRIRDMVDAMRLPIGSKKMA